MPGQIVCLGLKQAFTIAGNGPVGYADPKGGFLSDSLRESPPKIGIADRPEAGGVGPASNQSLLDWPGLGDK
ncbi:MAG: hypothetical protein HY787_13785 [Deltaproteobacteria bacterium]|nr:hypothetical protein [Deltaproteobacteria bacterium]